MFSQETIDRCARESVGWLTGARVKRCPVSLATERGADAIVMGAASESALERALLGSVSEYVLHRAASLVCVLHAAEHR